MIPGLGAGALLAASPGRLFAEQAGRGSFSLSVVTDQPDKAISLVQKFLKGMLKAQGNINYSEYILHGSHIADIVYTQSGQLVDFYRNKGSVNDALRSMADNLDLPRACSNPVLCHFSINKGMQKPKGFRVFKDNVLILEKTFPEKSETFVLNGVQGRFALEAAEDHSVRFVEASCRHKTCMSMGSISQAGQNLVCVPNRITVSISGTNLSNVDSITF